MSKHPFSKSACALALLLFCLAFGIPAAAQSTTQGAIGGTVKDPQGAVVPNATVSVKNDETNKEVTATTDDDGNFRVAQLQPGTYTVAATWPRPPLALGTSTVELIVNEDVMALP